MHSLIVKTFGGLSFAYYARNFFFGALLTAFPIFVVTRNSPMTFGIGFFLLLSALLYPYSRFVYERVIAFVVGENSFILNAVLMLVVKLMTMILCWVFAIFIAPVGLLWLYIQHTRAERAARSA